MHWKWKWTAISVAIEIIKYLWKFVWNVTSSGQNCVYHFQWVESFFLLLLGFFLLLFVCFVNIAPKCFYLEYFSFENNTFNPNSKMDFTECNYMANFYFKVFFSLTEEKWITELFIFFAWHSINCFASIVSNYFWFFFVVPTEIH